MSTPTDHLQTNTHSKKAHQKAGSRRARQFIGGVSWPESRVQVRQTTKQVVVQRFELGSPATARPLQGRLHQSPPPKSTTLHFSHAGPCFSGHTISHQVEGHVTTRQQSTCAQFCAIEGAQQRAQEAKRACFGGPVEDIWQDNTPSSCPASMPTFCLARQIDSGGAERADRHKEHPSRAWQHFLATAEGP